jgi:predicted transcriptional regulator
MSSYKQQLLDVVNSLPDDCTEEDFRYRLYVRQKAEEGLADIEHGRTYTHEEMVEIVKSWRKSSGPNPRAAT